MYISNSANNYSSRNFCGVLKDNAELRKALEHAPAYYLEKFAKTSERMAQKDDGRTFELTKYYFTNPFVSRQDIRLISSQNKRNFVTQAVGREIIPRNEISKGECYDDVIKNTNEILEKIYPEEPITDIPRQTSINRILKNTVK